MASLEPLSPADWERAARDAGRGWWASYGAYVVIAAFVGACAFVLGAALGRATAPPPPPCELLSAPIVMVQQITPTTTVVTRQCPA